MLDAIILYQRKRKESYEHRKEGQIVGPASFNQAPSVLPVVREAHMEKRVECADWREILQPYVSQGSRPVLRADRDYRISAIRLAETNLTT